MFGRATRRLPPVAHRLFRFRAFAVGVGLALITQALADTYTIAPPCANDLELDHFEKLLDQKTGNQDVNAGIGSGCPLGCQGCGCGGIGRGGGGPGKGGPRGGGPRGGGGSGGGGASGGAGPGSPPGGGPPPPHLPPPQVDPRSGSFDPSFGDDLWVPSPGYQLFAGISYNSRQGSFQSGDSHSTGYQGNDWFQDSHPETLWIADRLTLTYSAHGRLEFQYHGGEGSNFIQYRGVNGTFGAVRQIRKDGTGNDLYEYTDRDGTTYTFFAAENQLWKVTDPAGGVAYFGDATNAATARSTGFTSDMKPQVGYDAAGHRITYTYNSTTHLLTSVIAEAKSGSTWLSAGSEILIGKVTYDYYASTTSCYGNTRDLKLVTMITPLSNWSLSSPTDNVLVKKRYFRYYTVSEGSFTTPECETGGNGTKNIKLVIDPEGVRQADLADDSTLNDSYMTASDATLKPYCAAFFQYDTFNYYSIDRASQTTPDRSVSVVSSAFFNGECGCSGGGSAGTYSYTYEQNSVYPGIGSSTNMYWGTSTYPWGTPDANNVSNWTSDDWHTRTIIGRPDGSYLTLYYDYVDQLLGSVVSDGDPTSSSTHHWAIKYIRDDKGRVVATCTPASISSYAHSSGQITVSASSGLVSYEMFSSDTYLPGTVVRTEHSEGLRAPGSSNRYVDTSVTYPTSTDSAWRYFDVEGDDQRTGSSPISDHYPIRLVHIGPSTLRYYNTNEVTYPGSPGDYDEYVISYSFWGSTDWRVKTSTLSAPPVATSHNGSNSATDADKWSYIDTLGRVLFARTSDGRFGYYEYDAMGQLSRQIQDVHATSSDTELASQATLFGLTLPSAGLHMTTEYAYDTVGRLQSTTNVDTMRVSLNYYTELANECAVVLSVPQYEASGTTSTGPVSYALYNHAQNVEANAWIALNGGSTTTAPSAWITTTASDLITALSGSVGSVTRVESNVFDATGVRLAESHKYYALGSTLGATGSLFDATVYSYDVMGRNERTVSAFGTRARYIFDHLGRHTQTWIGTSEPVSGSFDPTIPNIGNYTQIESMEYDEGGVGNSLLTKKEEDSDGDWGTSSAADRRSTQFVYDYRGRLKLQARAQSPHTGINYDNRSRTTATATYSDVSNTSIFNAGIDVVSTATNRLSLDEALYDERGRKFKTVHHNIIQTSGIKDVGQELETLNWYDTEGRLIKTRGASLVKFAYDRLGRAVRKFVLAHVDEGDTGSGDYAAAGSVANDIVLEEDLSAYDSQTGALLFQAQFTRHHDAPTTATGSLDRNSDSDDLTITANDLKSSSSGLVVARAQISAYWYDSLDRPTHTAQYGTFGLNEPGGPSSFSRGSTAPSRGGSVLVTTTTYNADGTILEVESPGKAENPSAASGTRTRYLYDIAGRRVATISNYTGGSTSTEARTTDLVRRYQFGNGLLTRMWVDMKGDDSDGVAPTSLTGDDANDQVTAYAYGTAKGTVGSGTPVQSLIATGHLLREVTFPPQTSTQAAADRTVIYAYNALSEQVWTKNQMGTVISTVYDTGGRVTKRVVDTLDDLSTHVIDGSVRRIELGYNARGRVASAGQYDATTGGSEYNGIQYTYDNWGNITNFEQDRDSAVGGGGASAFAVGFDYVRNAPGNGRYAVRRTKTVVPEAAGQVFDINMVYSTTANGGLDDVISRVTEMTLTSRNSGGTPTTSGARVSYQYLGVAQVVGMEYPEPVSNLRRYTVSGSDPAIYTRLDVFNRVSSDVWTGGAAQAGEAIYDVAVAYDPNSNPTRQVDQKVKSGGSLIYSSKYTMDALNRVTQADRGHWTGTVIDSPSGVPDRYTENWGLTQTGNWATYSLDSINGSPNEIDETRAHNWVNQITDQVDTLPTPDVTTNPVHDRAGQMTDDGKTYKFVYDAFGRMVEIRSRSTNNPIKQYRYDALGERVAERLDVSGSGSVPDGALSGYDPWTFFVYDDRWRMVAAYKQLGTSSLTLASTATLKERFIHHAAGLDGMGGSSYIDAAAIRDQDTDNESGHILEDRTYILQNWRADVIGVMRTDGVMPNWFKYSAYGKHQTVLLVDLDDGNAGGRRDGGIGIEDLLYFLDQYDLGTPVADMDNNAGVGIEDLLLFLDLYDMGGGGLDSRQMYAGYQLDRDVSLYHVRYRVYSAELGRWLSEDPLGYHDGMNLYEYVGCRVVRARDPKGLCAGGCAGGTSPVPVRSPMPPRTFVPRLIYPPEERDPWTIPGRSQRPWEPAPLPGILDPWIDLPPEWIWPWDIPDLQPFWIPAGWEPDPAPSICLPGSAPPLRPTGGWPKKVAPPAPKPAPVAPPKTEEDPCSKNIRNKLIDAQTAACKLDIGGIFTYDFDQNPDPCGAPSFMPSNANPCALADGLANCIKARQDVQDWYIKCGTTPENVRGHDIRVDRLKEGFNNCKELCDKGRERGIW